MSISPNMLETVGMQANALVAELEHSFPLINPTVEDSMEKIMYRSGQRSVVEWVVNYFEENM